jgi:peptidoglycan/LPS O-acetylase OafA/YrhL
MKFPGVPIFFVTSGYLVSASLYRSDSLLNYLKNRALRIYPGLWACLLITILAIAILGKENFFNLETLKWLPSQMIGVIYTPSFLRDFGFGSYNASLWTITVELQFYILLPLFLIFLRGSFRKTPFLVALFLISLLTAVILRFNGFSAEFTANETTLVRIIRYSFLPHFYLFILGALMQNQKIFTSNYIYNRGHIWIIVYLAFVYLSPIIFNEIFNYYVGMLLLAVCTISFAYTLPKWGHNLLHGYDISYGVYIYHFIIINVIIELGKTGNWSYATLVIVFSYALGFSSWIFVERYFIKKKNSSS